MSGCVHCVWDDYREDVERWAERVDRAMEKARSKSKQAEGGRAEVDSASVSMDDDGGGSETNWPAPSPGETEHLFTQIPVGIREFMKTEKKLRKRKQERGEASA